MLRCHGIKNRVQLKTTLSFLNLKTMFAFTSLFLISANLARDISWFKQTMYHNDNIVKLENSWTECKEWSDTYNSIGADLSIQIDDIGISTTVNIDSIWRFNFTALCISLHVPLDWDNPELDETINYTISRVYTRDDIENIADNGAFWLIPGISYVDSNFFVYI